jgi:hypothetical protein
VGPEVTSDGILALANLSNLQELMFIVFRWQQKQKLFPLSIKFLPHLRIIGYGLCKWSLPMRHYAMNADPMKIISIDGRPATFLFISGSTFSI